MDSELQRRRDARTPAVFGFSRVLLVLALVLIDPAEARAQETTDQVPPPPPAATLLSGIEVLPTTYLWFPWIGVSLRPADTRLPSPSNTIDPGSLYGHLTWVAFMGQAEFRNASVGVITDFIHAPLKSGIDTRDILFGGGTANLTLNTGSAVALYRALALPNQNADVGLFSRLGAGRCNRLEPAEAAGVPAHCGQPPLLGRPADCCTLSL